MKRAVTSILEAWIASILVTARASILVVCDFSILEKAHKYTCTFKYTFTLPLHQKYTWQYAAHGLGENSNVS